MYYFGLCFAVTDGSQSLFLYSVLYKVIYYRLGTTLGESLVICVAATCIAVRGEFNGYVGVKFKELDKLVE